MSSCHSEVHRMQIDHLVDWRQNYRHQWRIALSGFDRRSPHSLVQAIYLGEQSVNFVSSFATQQRGAVGGILFQSSFQFAALRFGEFTSSPRYRPDRQSATLRLKMQSQPETRPERQWMSEPDLLVDRKAHQPSGSAKTNLVSGDESGD